MGTIYFWPILALCFVRSVVPFGYLLGLCLKFVWAFLELIFQFYWIMNLLLQGGWSLQSRFSAASKNANTFFRAPLPSELVTALGCSLSTPSDPCLWGDGLHAGVCHANYWWLAPGECRTSSGLRCVPWITGGESAHDMGNQISTWVSCVLGHLKKRSMDRSLDGLVHGNAFRLRLGLFPF